MGGPKLVYILGGPKSLGGPELVGWTSDPSPYPVYKKTIPSIFHEYVNLCNS